MALERPRGVRVLPPEQASEAVRATERGSSPTAGARIFAREFFSGFWYNKTMKKNNEYQQFQSLFNNLCRKVNETDKKYRPSGKYQTIKKSKKKQLLKLFKEVILILSRIRKELIELNKLQKQSKWLRKKHLNDRMKKAKISYIFNKQSILVQHLKVDIKSLFHWIFIIDDVLGKNVFSKHITAFRSLFLVHFSQKAYDSKKIRELTSGVIFSEGNARIVFLPFYGAKHFAGFKTKIENVVKDYIPEAKEEPNYNEKVRVIWENIDKLPESLKGRSFLSRLSQYGILSPNLNVVVESLIRVWEEVVYDLF